MDDPILQTLLAENGWMTEEQVAELEQVEVVTIRSRRSRGGMPPYFKIGHRTLYNRSDIADRIRANRKVSKSANTPASLSDEVLK